MVKVMMTKLYSLSARPLASLLFLAVVGAAVWAQDSRQMTGRFKPQPAYPPRGETSVPEIVVSPRRDHRIGPGDVIEVQVDLAPELSNTSRVNSAGTFLMPFIGRVRARQKTSEELAEEIARRLKDEYLKRPAVKVIVKQIYSHTYFIQGAVRRSGVYQIEGEPTLLELLTAGGGLADDYGTTAFIIRRVNPRSPELRERANGGEQPEERENATPEPAEQPSNGAVGFEILKANIAGLLKGAFEHNVALAPGDIVNIPRSDVFFVAGEVRAPGSFPLKDGTTLRQAISLAQGMTPRALSNRGVIYREDGKGKRQEIKVDIDAVMRGREEDITLAANDIVIIPHSAIKSAALPILNAFAAGLAWGVGGRLPAR
jgi:polysaccharide export outer membrane protein